MYVQRHFTNISHACANNTSRSVPLSFRFFWLTYASPRPSLFPAFLWVSRQNEGGVESNEDRVLTFITPSDVMNATCTQPLERTFPFRRTSCKRLCFLRHVYSWSWLVTATNARIHNFYLAKYQTSPNLDYLL